MDVKRASECHSQASELLQSPHLPFGRQAPGRALKHEPSVLGQELGMVIPLVTKTVLPISATQSSSHPSSLQWRSGPEKSAGRKPEP